MLSDKLDRLTGLEADVAFRAAGVAFLLCAALTMMIVWLPKKVRAQ
jgi:hypothetical protein